MAKNQNTVKHEQQSSQVLSLADARITQIKNSVKKGTYKVELEKLADRLLHSPDLRERKTSPSSSD